jgi:hypothetical protein
MLLWMRRPVCAEPLVGLSVAIGLPGLHLDVPEAPYCLEIDHGCREVRRRSSIH